MKQNASITLSKHVAYMTQPLLKNLEIQGCIFSRIYHDGSRICLGSMPSYIEETYCVGKHINKLHYYQCLPNKYVYTISGLDILLSGEAQQALKKQKEIDLAYGIQDRIFYMVAHRDYYEFCAFDLHVDLEKDSCSLAQRKLELEKFYLYFKNTAYDLIFEAEKDKLVKPWRKLTPSNLPEEVTLRIPEPKKIYHPLIPNLYLTMQEAKIARFLQKGYTVKVIAQKSKLSPRTVETYVTNLKNKLCCHNKSAIITALSQFEL